MEKILFAQRQLDLLQQYGPYGYEVLQEFRVQLRKTCPALQEAWEGDAFVFCCYGKQISRFYWEESNLIRIFIPDKQDYAMSDLVFECRETVVINWERIIYSIRIYLYDL